MRLLIVVILLALSAFFSSSETAMMSVNKIRIRSLEESGEDPRAAKLLKVLDDQPKMLSAILIGNNIVNISASAVTTVAVTGIFGNAFVGIATGVLTLLTLVFGEVAPKTAAAVRAESYALRVAGIIWFLMWLLTPLIFLIEGVSGLLLRLMGIDPDEKADTMTEEELRTVVEVSHEEGVIESDEKKMINNVVDFGDTVAKDIMVPRVDVTFLEVTASYDEVLEVVRTEKYTRYPVYEDTTDNVIGMLNIKDLFLLNPGEEFSLRNYLREPLYTYEFKKTSELMLELRKRNNIAVVLDEYGDMVGIVTLEDMLEEIVGEIRDEYDADEENTLRKISDKEYIVEGAMKLDDINDRLGLELHSEDYDSIGGIVIGLLEHLPEEGEEVTWDNLRIVVEKVDRNRIEQLHVYILDPPAEENGEEKEEN